MPIENTIVELFAGDDLALYVTVEGCDGNPKDISTATDIRYAVRANPSLNNPALIFKKLGEGITVVDGVGGKFRIDLDGKDTEGMTGTYFHIARLTDELGRKSTILAGNLILREAGFSPDDDVPAEP